MGTPQNNTNVAKAVRKEYAAANLPQTTLGTLFTVTGKVLVSDIVGEVITTAIQAQANSIKLVNTTTVGADTDMCAALEINGDAIGTFYTITGTPADAMIATTSGVAVSQATPMIVSAGTIQLNTTASSTGKVKWTLYYIPLETGSKVA